MSAVSKGTSGGEASRLDGLVVRRATPADAAGVARILNEVIEDGRFSLLDTPFSEEAERAYIEALPERGFIHVGELPGEGIVGFETLEPYAGFVTHELDHVATMGTWVDAGYRRRGIGRALWRATREAALADGFEKIVTDVRADNDGSLAFHRSLGFTVIGTARRQARMLRPDGAVDYMDVVLIERFLDDGAGG